MNLIRATQRHYSTYKRISTSSLSEINPLSQIRGSFVINSSGKTDFVRDEVHFEFKNDEHVSGCGNPFTAQNSDASIKHNNELVLCNHILYVGYCTVAYFAWVFYENTRTISNDLPLVRETLINSSIFLTRFPEAVVHRVPLLKL